MTQDPLQRADNPTYQMVLAAGKPPEEARFFWTGGPVEVAERTWFVSQASGVTAFETDEGLVLVDSGAALLAPSLAGRIREKTQAPVHTAVFTHGHLDHAYGLQAFLAPGQAPPRVVAHRDMPARFARYERTQRHNQALNARQFGGTVQAHGHAIFQTFQPPKILPDVLYDDALSFEVGGVRFELRHARGETDDHTWVYCPTRGVLCPGDLFIWAVPNAGNPQKAQRYPWDWAVVLREMAARAPRTLCPGHGGPVVDDPERVGRMLSETAAFLEDIVEQTLAALEDGSPPHVDIVRRVKVPVSQSPWLQPLYDDPEFLVRSLIRQLGGWYTGRPSELKPAPREDVARAVAGLAGGAAALAERAEATAASGDLAVACSLADFALEADPAHPRVREVVAAIYEARAKREPSLMAVNLFRSAAAYAREGRPYR